MTTVMGVDQFETITMSDKEKRDEMFRELRGTGNANERRAVRFSNPEPVMASEDEICLDKKGRPRYTSMYSVAYPTTPMQRKTRTNKPGRKS